MVDAGKIVVTKTDRERAWPFAPHHIRYDPNPGAQGRWLRGDYDDQPVIQAFALHRTEATAELVEALKAAAEILESYVEFLHRMPADDLELHPYIPAVEDAFDKAHAALAKHLTDGPGLTERLERS